MHYTASHYLLSSRTKAFDFGTKFTSFMVLPHSIVFFYWTNETEYYDSVTICLPNLSVQLMRFYGVFVIIP